MIAMTLVVIAMLVHNQPRPEHGKTIRRVSCHDGYSGVMAIMASLLQHQY